MRILGPPSGTQDVVLRNLVRLKASSLFIDTIFPALWLAAQRYNVDPVGAVAQAAKETGWGRFGGVITAEWRNVCGLKVPNPAAVGLTGGTDYERFAHQIMQTWHVGCLAMVQHLVAYVGCSVGDSNPFELVDPRYQLVVGKHRCEHFADLSGKWAGSATYGQSIETLAAELSQER